jgi:molecular chaperone DnaJ
VTRTSQSPFGVIQQTLACDQCQGSGESFDQICGVCDGQKRSVENTKLDIDIPAGIDDGMVIKMTGEGNDGVGTKQAGDLYVRFSVQTEEK